MRCQCFDRGCIQDVFLDHRLIVSKLIIQIRPRRRPHGQKTVKRVNVAKLRNATTAGSLACDLDVKMQDLPNDHTAQRSNGQPLETLCTRLP